MEANGFCTNTAPIWQFAGYIVLVLKIIIPAILIILGVIALGKAVIADDQKEIKTAVNSLIKKFIVAVCIFFVPTVISALFSAVYSSDKNNTADYVTCVKCISNPNGDCKGLAEKANK